MKFCLRKTKPAGNVRCHNGSNCMQFKTSKLYLYGTANCGKRLEDHKQPDDLDTTWVKRVEVATDCTLNGDKKAIEGEQS